MGSSHNSVDDGTKVQKTLRRLNNGFRDRVHKIGVITAANGNAQIASLVFEQFQQSRLDFTGHIKRASNGHGFPTNEDALAEAIWKARKNVFIKLCERDGTGVFENRHNVRFAQTLIREAFLPPAGRVRQAKRHHR
jgi:hypothetical protein